MMSIENEALNQLMNNINDKNLKSNKDEKVKKTKNTNSGKKFCKAAVKYNTFGDAYRDIEKGINVYCVAEEINGEISKIAYTQCSKTSQDGECYCHIHNRTIKNKNSPIKNYDDIIPSSESDKTRWLLNLKDDFFENMGKRGAIKKNDKNNHKLDENDPVNLILRDKDPRKLALARICIMKILTNDTEFLSNINIESTSSEKSIKKKTQKSQSNIDSLVDLISSVDNKKTNNITKSNNIKKNSTEKDDSSDDAQSEDDDSDENISDDPISEDSSVNSSKITSNNVQNKEENSDHEDDENNYDSSDDEDGVSCIQINTIKGKQLWLNEETKMIYEPEDDDETEAKPMGELAEVPEEFHTIYHNSKYYTVINKINNKGKLVYYCSLTDRLFNKKFKHIGKRTMLKNKEYKFEYF